MALSKLQKKELNKLLDKYEKRRDYGREEKSSRRTMLKIDKKNYPAYFHVSDSAFRREYNADMEELEKRGWVTLEWVRFEKGDTLERVVLKKEALPEIYQFLRRTPKRDFYNNLLKETQKIRSQAPRSLQAFYRDLEDSLKKLEDLPSHLKFTSIEDYRDFFLGLNTIMSPSEGEILKRQLSTSLYGDSKRFENLERRFLKVIRSYCLKAEESEMEAEEILSERGITSHQAHINVSGPLVITTPRGEADLSVFCPDVGLSPSTVREMEIRECRADFVVTVENLTSFYHYIKEGKRGSLVIYLGGYHNYARRLILVKLQSFFKERNENIPFYHWGDIDLGGLRIWYHLKTKTGIDFRPLYMNPDTYLTNLHKGQPLKEKDLQKLKELLDNSAYAPLHSLIERMLEKKVKVEQEAVVFGPGCQALELLTYSQES